MDRISKLEKEIKNIKENLRKKEFQLITLKLEDKKNKYYNTYEELLSKDEMELIFQFLFAYYLCKEYQYNCSDIYLNKVAELLDIWPKDILNNFEEIICLYIELETYLSEDEITDKINKFAHYADILDEDDIDKMIEIFC
jgi:hypothetical protein